jgi:CelD/BcsL family acetyltransferase involved in cellulose biosynthesis
MKVNGAGGPAIRDGDGVTQMTLHLEQLNGTTFVDEWDTLADRVHATPFVRFGWIAAWWQNFGHGEMRVLTARSGRRLTGLLPMLEVGNTIRPPVNVQTPVFGFLAEDEAVAADLVGTLLRGRRPMVMLDPIDVTDVGTQPFLTAAEQLGYRVLTETHRHSPYIEIDRPWEVFENGIDKKTRSEIKRRRRRLEELGELRLEVSDGKEDLERTLDEGFRVEASGRKGRIGTAIALDPATHSFYRDMSRWAANEGLLRLCSLRLDGKMIAFDLSLQDGESHYLVKTGYDVAFARYGPGMLLRYEILARVFAEGLATYEFLGSDAPWKREWTRTRRHRIEIRAFAPTLKGTARWSAANYGVPAAKRLRRVARNMLRR